MLMDSSIVFNEHLRSLMQVMFSEGASRAAQGFSSMVGKKLSVSQPRVHLVPLADVPNLMGGPESEAVGIYLRAQGDIAGQLMLVLAFPKALELVDLMMDVPSGTTQRLGAYERSALAELGNLTGSFFLNAISAFAGIDARPTPPAVMVDMVGAILDIVVATHGIVGKHVLLLQVAFIGEEREAQADFWVIPDPATLESIARRDWPHEQ